MAVTFGVSMLAVAPRSTCSWRWLYVKLLLVLVLIGYHGACFALLQQFASDRNSRSERWYRVFNEIPALLLIGIVVLVVVKPSEAARLPSADGQFYSFPQMRNVLI
jgi:putative membrane protein